MLRVQTKSCRVFPQACEVLAVSSPTERRIGPIIAEPSPGFAIQKLPDFDEYVRRKYALELDEDLITMIEDLIERQKEIAPALKPRTIH